MTRNQTTAVIWIGAAVTAVILVGMTLFSSACGHGAYQGTAACEDGWKRFTARVESDVKEATRDELRAYEKGHDTWVKACDAYGENAVNRALQQKDER